MTTEPADARIAVGRADGDWLADVHKLLADAWEAFPDVVERDRLLFELAVQEVAANIVEHAGCGSCSVEITVTADEVSGVLSDDGPPVEICLKRTRMPDAMAEGGRGLAMAQSALDTLRYTREPNENVWRLVRRRAEP